MFRLSNHDAPVSVLQRGWDTECCSGQLEGAEQTPQPAAGAAAVASQQPRTGGVCAWAAESSGHHVLHQCTDHWAPLPWFPSPHSVTQWLRECERAAEGRTGASQCIMGAERDSVISLCSRKALGVTGALGIPRETEECAELSPAVRVRTRLRWGLLSHFRTRFDSCCIRNLLFSPAWAGLPSLLWFVSCDISLLFPFLSWGFGTLQV